MRVTLAVPSMAKAVNITMTVGQGPRVRNRFSRIDATESDIRDRNRGIRRTHSEARPIATNVPSHRIVKTTMCKKTAKRRREVSLNQGIKGAFKIIAASSVTDVHAT
jgi:hypothetical protein